MDTPKELIEARPKIMNPAAMQDLLEKTRLVSRALQSRKERGKPDYPKLARLMSDLSAANVYVINGEGRILGYAWISEYDCPIMADQLIGVERMNQAKAKYLGDVQNPQEYQKKMNVFNQINDSRIFQETPYVLENQGQWVSQNKKRTGKTNCLF